MTLKTSTYKQNFAGNGSSTLFTAQYKIESSDLVVVYHYDADDVATLLVEGTDYEVINAGQQNGFSIRFPITGSAFSTLAANETLKTYRKDHLRQLVDLSVNGFSDPEAIEKALDLIVGMLQKLATSPRESDLTSTYVDALSRQLKNLTDPVDDQDAVTVAYLMDYINTLASNDYSAAASKWSGTTSGGGSTLSIPGATVSDVNSYHLVVNNIPMEPGQDFTVDAVADTITLTPAVGNGLDWWVVVSGLNKNAASYPVHDHLATHYTEAETAQIISAYSETSYSNTPAVKDVYVIGIRGSNTAPASFKDGQLILFKPTTANVEADVRLILGAIPEVPLKTDSGGNLGAGWLVTTAKLVVAQYDSGAGQFRCIYPLQVREAQYANVPVSALKTDIAQAGHHITFDSAGAPQTELNCKWVSMGGLTLSGDALDSSATPKQWYDIPANAKKLKIKFWNASCNAIFGLRMKVGSGAGASPTYLGVAGNYEGACLDYRTGVGVDISSVSSIPLTVAHGATYIQANQKVFLDIEFERYGATNEWNFTVIAVVTGTVPATNYSSYTAVGRVAALPAELSAIKIFGTSAGAINWSGGYGELSYYGNPDE